MTNFLGVVVSLEYSVPVWDSACSGGDKAVLKRVQLSVVCAVVEMLTNFI